MGGNEGSGWLSYREANTFPGTIVWTGVAFHAKRDASLACDWGVQRGRRYVSFSSTDYARPACQGIRASKVLSDTSKHDTYSVFVLFKLTP